MILLAWALAAHRTLFTGHVPLSAGSVMSSEPWRSYYAPIPDLNRLTSDPIDCYLPWDIQVSDALREGRLPLWSRRWFAGQPLFADAQTGALYPPKIIAQLIFSPLWATVVLLYLHLLIAGGATYGTLRYAGVNRAGSLCGALAWMFSGYSMVWFGFRAVNAIVALLPLTLLCVERARVAAAGPATGEIRALGPACVVLACAFFAGHLQFAVYAALIAGAYTFARWPRTARRPVAPLGAAAFLGTVSVLIAAVQLVPASELARAIPRARLSFEDIRARSIPLGHLATLISPDLFGGPTRGFFYAHGKRHPYFNASEFTISIGCFNLLMALLGLRSRRRDLAAVLGCLALYALLSGFGSWVYWPFHRWVPGFAYLQPTRIVGVFAFAAALLAALGVERLTARSIGSSDAARRDARDLRWIATAASILFALSALGLTWTTLWKPAAYPWCFRLLARWGVFDPTVEEATARWLVHLDLCNPGLLLPCVCLGISALLIWRTRRIGTDSMTFVAAVLLALAEPLSFGLRYNPAYPADLILPDLPVVQFLHAQRGPFRVAALGLFPPNTLGAYRLEDVAGYDSLFPERYRSLCDPVSIHAYTRVALATAATPLLGLLNVRFVLTRDRLTSNDLHLAYDDGTVKAYVNARCLPRAFLVHKCRVEADRTRARDSLLSGAVDPAVTVILECPVPVKARQGWRRKTVAGASAPATAAIQEYTDESLGVVTDDPDDAFLVVSDGHDPGWRATIDGGEVPVLPADVAFQCVAVSAGHHEVRFRYRPRSVLAGAIISALTLLAIGLSMMGDRTGRRAMGGVAWA